MPETHATEKLPRISYFRQNRARDAKRFQWFMSTLSEVPTFIFGKMTTMGVPTAYRGLPPNKVSKVPPHTVESHTPPALAGIA